MIYLHLYLHIFICICVHTGGHAVSLKWSMHNIFDMHPGDVFWAASDVGWVVGHSYIVYGPLLAGCTTVLYEGKPIHTPGTRFLSYKIVSKMPTTGIEQLTILLTFLYICKLICDIDTGNFWRTIERHKVNALFTAPTALRAIKRLDAEGMLYSMYMCVLQCILYCMMYIYHTNTPPT